MPEIIVVYWRDIPAQVIVGKGRRAAKVQLSERFEQAIDRCAMRIGAKDTDSYLAEWRKVPLREVEGNANSLAESESSRLEMEYDSVRLAYLVENGGWENESNLAGAAKL
ncbi:MAG: virulence factor [Albidovulum sp.]|nr:virulence factor [Albidovulum sp.]MDE0305301.1 virulence factor [Albidovulum sp.]MDE0530995.1 virulence factor [Albidovulum sp.]